MSCVPVWVGLVLELETSWIRFLIFRFAWEEESELLESEAEVLSLLAGGESGLSELLCSFKLGAASVVLGLEIAGGDWGECEGGRVGRGGRGRLGRLGGNDGTTWSRGELIWLRDGIGFGHGTVVPTTTGKKVYLLVVRVKEFDFKVTIVIKEVFYLFFKFLHAIVFCLAHDSGPLYAHTPCCRADRFFRHWGGVWSG